MASAVQKLENTSFDSGGGGVNENATTSSGQQMRDNEATKSSLGSFKKVAIEFQSELNSVLKSKPPISKEKINQIVDEAIKAVRNYKHVVYYVETFIKNVKFYLKFYSKKKLFFYLNFSF
jgi:hypothetical protein